MAVATQPARLAQTDGPTIPGFRDQSRHVERLEQAHGLNQPKHVEKAEDFVPGSRRQTRASITGPIITAARGIMVAVVALIMLGALYSTDIVQNPQNPNTFTNLTSQFGNYGEIAFIMIGLGLIALGASVAFGYFGNFGGGDR